MSVNLYNSERYYDPTAYEALTRIEAEAKKAAFRPIVYICSPFSGDTETNIEKARMYCKFAVDSGCIPIAPHLFFPQFLSDENPKERNLAIFMDVVLLSKCAELWVFGDKVSKGMGIEIAKAKKKGQPIRYFTEACEEVTKMKQIKAIQTEYNGYLFRSRLEARWAVFFDACGVQWEYEPEGYDLGNGILYLPDFLLHNVAGRAYGDLFVEVKGHMTHNDSKKIKRFIEIGMQNPNEYGKSKTAILLVGNIPEGETMIDIINDISCKAYDDHHGLSMYNFESIDGDYFAAHPGVNKNGRFELFGDDCNYLCDMDVDKTAKAYRLARQARFEHGETPMKRRF